MGDYEGASRRTTSRHLSKPSGFWQTIRQDDGETQGPIRRAGVGVRPAQWRLGRGYASAAVRQNASAYMHSASLIKLKIIESTCPNCKQPFDDMLHIFYYCFVAEYVILLLHNLIYYNFGLQLTITPSLILVTEPSHLKDIKADPEVKQVILNLIQSLKNNIYLNFYGKKIFVSPFSSKFCNSLLKRTVHGAFRACNNIYIKIPPANPLLLP